MTVYDDHPITDGYGRQVVVLSTEIDNGGGGGSGSATAANQEIELQYLDSIDGNIDDIVTNTNKLTSIDNKLTSQATGAKQDNILSAIQGINTKTLQADQSNAVVPTIQRRIALSDYTLSVFRNLGANNTLNVKNVLGNVFAVSFTNKNASTRYFQLWNTTGTAGSGSLLEEFQVAGNSQLILGADYFDINGTYFDTGIAFGFSSTSTTFTGATAADQNTVIKYL